MSRIVVIGDTTLDVTVIPPEPMRHAADVPAAIRLAPGGQGANVAVRLSRQGIAAELVTGLAGDPAATLLRATLEAEGVRVTGVPVDTTAAVVVLLDERGERSMVSQRAPFADRALDAVDPAAGWVVVSGYLLLESDAVALELAEVLAGHRGCRVLLGCTVPERRVTAWRAAAAALRPHLVLLNRDEADALGAPPGAGTVITDAHGAIAVIGPTTAEARREPGQPPTDTTGAGDAFAATLVAALSRAPWPPQEAALATALSEAMSVAAAVSRTAGAQGRVAGERAPAEHP